MTKLKIILAFTGFVQAALAIEGPYNNSPDPRINTLIAEQEFFSAKANSQARGGMIDYLQDLVKSKFGKRKPSVYLVWPTPDRTEDECFGVFMAQLAKDLKAVGLDPKDSSDPAPGTMLASYIGRHTTDADVIFVFGCQSLAGMIENDRRGGTNMELNLAMNRYYGNMASSLNSFPTAPVLVPILLASEKKVGTFPKEMMNLKSMQPQTYGELLSTMVGHSVGIYMPGPLEEVFKQAPALSPISVQPTQARVGADPVVTGIEALAISSANPDLGLQTLFGKLPKGRESFSMRFGMPGFQMATPLLVTYDNQYQLLVSGFDVINLGSRVIHDARNGRTLSYDCVEHPASREDLGQKLKGIESFMGEGVTLEVLENIASPGSQEKFTALVFNVGPGKKKYTEKMTKAFLKAGELPDDLFSEPPVLKRVYDGTIGQFVSTSPYQVFFVGKKIPMPNLLLSDGARNFFADL